MNRAVAWAGRHPGWWLLAYLVVTGALYQTAIRLPLYEPWLIAPTALDRHIPLVPWTAWPYMTYFALMPSFVVLARRHPERGALLMAAGLAVVGNLCVNHLAPTALAEPLALADAGDGLLARIVAGDTPRAALPSGHVALPVALAVLAFRGRLAARWLYVPWAAMMAVVVLTTKQHVVADVAAGLAWGALAPRVTARLVGLGRESRGPRPAHADATAP